MLKQAGHGCSSAPRIIHQALHRLLQADGEGSLAGSTLSVRFRRWGVNRSELSSPGRALGSQGPKSSRVWALLRSRLGVTAAAGLMAVVAGTVYAFSPHEYDHFKTRFMLLAAKRDHNVETPSVSKREKRFLTFSSLEYHGEVFMSPRDFLDCVTRDEPRSRIKRKHLTDNDVQETLKRTPEFGKGTKRLFRRLDSDGIISYTEYLFLLCVLTKPEEGFKIAFNMFDTDGDKRVDKKEFLVKSKEIVGMTKVQETTLLTHFFGPKGDRTLTYEDFRRFMDNLQTEVLEIEFNEFSYGKNNISESDFARILLRYTPVTTEERKQYIKRVQERIPDEGEGITFEQFRLFCQFLNTLDDFTIAVKLYTFADLPVSQAEFARAVKVATGFALEPHVVDVVFKIFDVNNDGRLSYAEFISVMKERLHRGFRSRTAPTEGWPAFKKCVREKLKRY